MTVVFQFQESTRTWLLSARPATRHERKLDEVRRIMLEIRGQEAA